MKEFTAKLRFESSAIELVDRMVNEQGEQLKTLPDSEKKIILSPDLFDKYIAEISELAIDEDFHKGDWQHRFKGIIIEKQKQ